MYDAVQAEKHRIDQWTHVLNPDLTLLCFDMEGVDGDTSEYGSAWYRTSDIIHTQPGREEKSRLASPQANHFGRGLHGLTSALAADSVLAPMIGLMRVPLLFLGCQSQTVSAFVNVWQLQRHVLVGDDNAADVAKMSNAENFILSFSFTHFPPFSLWNYPAKHSYTIITSFEIIFPICDK